jgi:gliding motility-associated lipoprotein GldH
LNLLKNFLPLFLVAASLQIAAPSCTSIDLYEKSVVIPGHDWKRNFQPSFAFTIKDTTSPYQIFLVLRHNEKYNFNNIYINLYTQQPGEDSTRKERFDLKLATTDKGWLASGMDDIYEHRILLNPPSQDIYFPKPGDYKFRVEQIMREDPLENVLNVGLRVEKKQ